MTADRPDGPLGARAARGAGFMIAFRLCDRLIGIASLAVLARLLAPEDFGLFALAMATVAIVEVFGQVGSDLALIRDRKAIAAVLLLWLLAGRPAGAESRIIDLAGSRLGRRNEAGAS